MPVLRRDREACCLPVAVGRLKVSIFDNIVIYALGTIAVACPLLIIAIVMRMVLMVIDGCYETFGHPHDYD